LLIIGALVWGMAIGWIGQMILGGKGIGNNDWLQALVAGAEGSVLGGTVGSILLLHRRRGRRTAHLAVCRQAHVAP